MSTSNSNNTNNSSNALKNDHIHQKTDLLLNKEKSQLHGITEEEHSEATFKEEINHKPVSRVGSLDHVTPKSWKCHLKPVPKGGKQSNSLPSPDKSQKNSLLYQAQWKPVQRPHSHSNPKSFKSEHQKACAEKSHHKDSLPEHQLPSKEDNDCEQTKVRNNCDEDIKNEENVFSQNNKRLSKPRTMTDSNISHRPSCRRNSKSPGFSTLRRMWDSKTSQTENEPPSAFTYPKKSIGSSDTASTAAWRSVRTSSKKYLRSPSTEKQSLSVNILSPAPFRNGSAKSDDPNQSQSYDNAEHEVDSSHENEIEEKRPAHENKISSEQSASETEIDISDTSSRYDGMTSEIEKLHEDALNGPEINDQEKYPNIEVGVYGGVEYDSVENRVDNVEIYNGIDTEPMSNDTSHFKQSTTLQYDVSFSHVVKPSVQPLPSSPAYLPMTSQVPGPQEISYVDMNSDSEVIEPATYSDHIVAPPLQKDKSKREYYDIDPAVPPPPDHEPPKLPSDRKHSVGDAVDTSEPPPLPPDNAVGRRSITNIKEKNLKIVLQHSEQLSKQSTGGKNEKKLKYVEVECGDNKVKFSSPSPHRRTDYSDVVVQQEHERYRDRSGSGISDESVHNVANKKQMNVKQKLQSLFTKEEPKAAQTKISQENLTDFEKERNKKKRISARFLRKKPKDAHKAKKEMQNESVQTDSYDVGAYQESIYSENTNNVASSRISSSVPVTSSSSCSPGSSGDGEVSKANQRTEATEMAQQKSSMTYAGNGNTSVNQAATFKSLQRLPQPRAAKSQETFSQNMESTFLAYPNTWNKQSADDEQRPKVSSFLHGSSARPVSSPPAARSMEPPPVPPHKRLSATSAISCDVIVDPSTREQPDQRGVSSSPNAPTAQPRHKKVSTNPDSPLVSRSQGGSRESTPPPLPPKEDTYSLAVEDGPHLAVGVYNAADDVPLSSSDDDTPPPLPEKDETLYEFIPASHVVPPSPMLAGDQGYKFLESEPLYQTYRRRTMSHASAKRHESVEKQRDKSHSEPARSPNWEKGLMSEDMGMCTLWRSIPEVVDSRCAENLSAEELKLQQAQFEVITSEASYLRSLNILVQHFMYDGAMLRNDVLPNNDRRRLFSNIETVRSVEQKFFRDLEDHFRNDIKLTQVSDYIAKYAKDEFNVYVLYIQNQVYQDRVLEKLQRRHERFGEELSRLEASPTCNKLPLSSFLMLPMQRVTRLPLLVSAIVNAADAAGEQEACARAKLALGVVSKLVKKCNESARKMQQTEQLAEIAAHLDYSSSIKMFALVSQSRNLIKKGEMNIAVSSDSKKSTKISRWLFLFTDVLLIAKKKSSMEFNSAPRYEVVDWANRKYIAVNEHAVTENAIYLVILENQAGKRVEMTLMPMAQNELSRWENALNPSKVGDAGESIYESWDCPQYQCIYPYEAQQPDELNLEVNDIMQVLKKTSDGWLEGERLRDGESGWFPASYCEEIEDEHVRSRNMKNLFRMYAHS